VADLQELRYITLSGEVRAPGIYAARKGERLSSILERAGGYTKDAFPKGAVFTRVSVQERQQELINRTVDQLEAEVMSRRKSRSWRRASCFWHGSSRFAPREGSSSGWRSWISSKDRKATSSWSMGTDWRSPGRPRW
jgi:hypothetical protein